MRLQVRRLDRRHRDHVEAIRQWQFVKFTRDRLGLERVGGTFEGKIDVRRRLGCPLCAGAEENRAAYFSVTLEHISNEVELGLVEARGHSGTRRAWSQACSAVSAAR